jgi:catechol 2,3-dioxygenase-like lactoylglutathione lyase family enzyme
VVTRIAASEGHAQREAQWSPPLLERYTFMAVTTADLARARTFWVDHLLCPIIEESSGEYFIVDAGGLKLCVDVDDARRDVAGSDPVIAFRVSSIVDIVSALRSRGVSIVNEVLGAETGSWAEIRDPDGHTILLTEPR